ncbi:helix-turn-helix domain-containing protein [Oceanimonas sp. NS1]|nr:helix-turn-helix domain-containing protein [Oceanimonas sp. NS1]
MRITQARRLLLQSDDSIANIAVACGFASSTHFSHCFKDFFGVSPARPGSCGAAPERVDSPRRR